MVYSANIPPTGAVVSESPFVRSLDVIAMMPDWGVMAAVTRGTNYIRDLAETYLPQEPREDDDAYRTRVDRDRDGRVTVADMMQFSSQWGWTCPST